MNDAPASDAVSNFVETLEYRRFAEFCDACRHYQYIGLCFGRPGVGKTLSARRYARWDCVANLDLYSLPDKDLTVLGTPATVFYTPGVVNTPRSIGEEVERARTQLHRIAREPLNRHQRERVARLREQYQQARAQYLAKRDWLSPLSPPPPEEPAYANLTRDDVIKEQAILDPTSLVLIDEADRLKMVSLEATRDMFDRGSIGLILIGMPGIEKRLARYPQLYSRIGFVHEFRPLRIAEVRELLERKWAPPGVNLPPLDDEAIVAIMRITGGNFRLLHRLLAQAERISRINELPVVTQKVIDAARESLVIGQL